MIYQLGSLIFAQGATLVLLGLIVLLRFRRAIDLSFVLVGTIVPAVFFFFTTPAGGWAIDFALGVALLPDKRFDTEGFHLGASVVGVLSAAVAVLLPRLLAPERRDRLIKHSALCAFGVLVAEGMLARQITIEQRIEWLTESNDGLRRYVGEAHHRVMPDPVPLLPDQRFRTEPVLTAGLEVPASLAFAGDGSLFIGEQRGRILLLRKDAQSPDEFHQVEDIRVVSESGLLDLEYAEIDGKEYLYLYYTRESTRKNRIERLLLDGHRIAGSEVVLDDLPGHRMHNGGGMVYASDGKLYVGTGTADHRSMSRLLDVPARPQGLDNLYGKVLRLNPDGSTPDDNPYPGTPMFARGLRMVWRVREDPVSRRIFFTENGSADHDELNVLYPRANYGHPVVRGLTGSRRFQDPLIDMKKTIGVTGFDFYSGSTYPEEYRNDIFFCSYVTGLIYWLDLDESDARLPRDVIHAIRPTSPDAGCKLDIAQGPDGNLWYSNITGVYRLIAVQDASQLAAIESLGGADLYRLYCQPCHGENGEGNQLYPPLNRASWVTGDPRTAARIVLFGLQGKIEVRDKTYQGKMLAFGQSLRDEDIANVLTHIRSSWDNDAAAIDAETVSEVRKSGYGLRLE